VINLDKNNILSYALDNYLNKQSTTRIIFMADYRLICNFHNYYNKNKHKPLLVKNQINIIINLFNYTAVVNMLRFFIGETDDFYDILEYVYV
jgi:hypothetical protein